MIAGLVFLGFVAAYLLLWIIKETIVYLLKFKFNDVGLNLTYILQARWELFQLETWLRVGQIKAREKKAQQLHPVEVVEVETEELPPAEGSGLHISLDKHVTVWDVHYSAKGDQYKTIQRLNE